MKKIILSILIFLTLGSFFVWQGIYLPRSEPKVLLWGFPKEQKAEEKLFFIEKGSGLFEISGKLEKEGLIKNSFYFNFYVLLTGNYKRLQAGKYFISPSINIVEIAKKIISGDTVKIIITIPEGFTVKQIEERLGMELPGENLEGFLFPDTYYFPVDITGEEAVKIMRHNFEKKLAPYRNEISDAGLTLLEIITIASLIEKEVISPEDKKLVSGILWKRLEANMPLQVDATITYITGKKTVKIPLEDLKIDSPYNTYKYQGLPIGPISNPGLESIFAALYPKDSPYWFYLSKPDGQTVFSKTYREHNIAKAEYLK